jgi:hypothetical protein
VRALLFALLLSSAASADEKTMNSVDALVIVTNIRMRNPHELLRA